MSETTDSSREGGAVVQGDGLSSYRALLLTLRDDLAATEARRAALLATISGVKKYIQTTEDDARPPVHRTISDAELAELMEKDSQHMSEPRLLPCPFCGGGLLNFVSSATDTHFVQCEECGAEGGGGETQTEALDGWNRRAPLTNSPPASPEETTPTP